MKLEELNALPEVEARAAFERCCGSARWVAAMETVRPFRNRDALVESASRLWRELTESDWREAFRHHPRIGDVESLRQKFANTRAWASAEQAGAASASEATLQSLAAGNGQYEDRFGYIFIVCATGKSADEMLAILQIRLRNDPAAEIRVAAGEQEKITQLRLEKLIES